MKKENDKISIIIPIYNVEQYIEKCVLSCMEQIYKNIEIILVDDGSKDSSSKIIDDLSKKDNRIIVIHKKNDGVSSARNAGLKKASGHYIVFIDGDDYVDNNYISYLYSLIKTDYDMAVNENYYGAYINNNENNNTKIEDSEEVIEGIYNGKYDVAVWNKIYKKDFLDKNNIIFNDKIWFGEGMLFNITCLQYTDKVVVGNKKVYHQTFNINSAMRNFNIENYFCGLESLKIQKELWKKENKNIRNAFEYHKRSFNISILKGIIRTNKQEELKSDYKKCIRNLKKNISIPLKANISLRTKIVNILISINPVFFIKMMVNLDKKKAEKYINM